MTASERQIVYQKRRRARGLCGWGGCKTRTEKYYCREHRRQVNDRRRQHTNGA